MVGYGYRLTHPTSPQGCTNGPSSLLHQRIARGEQADELAHAAAAVGMHRPGGALVGLLDFRGGQMAAERQAEQLPVVLLRRQRPGIEAATERENAHFADVLAAAVMAAYL